MSCQNVKNMKKNKRENANQKKKLKSMTLIMEMRLPTYSCLKKLVIIKQKTTKVEN